MLYTPGGYNGRILLPQKRNEWRQSSQRLSHHCIPDQIRFRLIARLDDGAIYWRGWFNDREDADAFLFAMATGSLHQEPDLWRLPTPQWHPDFSEGLHYEFSTVQFVTTTGAGTYTIPTDFDVTKANSFEVIAGGGCGHTIGSATYPAGGGGAAYSKTTNLSVTIGQVLNTSIATGGALSGNAGADCWVSTTMVAPISTTEGALAKGGTAGTDGGNNSGGLAASGIGNTKFSGGASGTTGSNPTTGSTGGGGAAGPNGNGANSGSIAVSLGSLGAGTGGGAASGGSVSAAMTGTNQTATAGGNNSNGTDGGAAGTLGGNGQPGAARSPFGGAGGGGGASGGASTGVGGAGAAGEEWDPNHGAGGGGGASGQTASGAANGGLGGLYGAGGGAGNAGGAGAAGAQGLLVVTYNSLTVLNFFGSDSSEVRALLYGNRGMRGY